MALFDRMDILLLLDDFGKRELLRASLAFLRLFPILGTCSSQRDKG